MTEPGTKHSRAELSALARELYIGGRWLPRKLQHWRPRICPFERLLPHVPAGASVLDAGCGCGLFLGMLAKTGRRPRGIGFDVSPAAISAASAMAQRVASTAGGGAGSLEFMRLDAGDPWPNAKFDVVSMIDVMHHVTPVGQRRFFAQAARHVAPGGALLYKDMCRRPAWRAAPNRLHDL